MTSQKKFGPIFSCFYSFFHVKLRAQVQDLQKREFYDLPEHGTATTKARGGLGTIQTSWARRAIKIMAVDSCDIFKIKEELTEKIKPKVARHLKKIILYLCLMCLVLKPKCSREL